MRAPAGRAKRQAAAETGDPMAAALTEEVARLAYLLILGRPPENDAMLRAALSYGTVRRLRDAFLNGPEFELIVNRRPKAVRADAPRLAVVCDADDATLLRMLAAVGAAWDAAPAATPGDGAAQLSDLIACLHRNGLELPDPAHVAELGCGAGRVTADLAERFATVTACDASPVQLATAERLLRARGLTNVTLRPAADLGFGLPDAFDLFYSYHALHHSPPPLAARALARALAALHPGGVAVFQLASYAYGYAYDLATSHDGPHVLPQAAVFAIAGRAGCEPLEVFDDLSLAPHALWRSTMFVLRKRRP